MERFLLADLMRLREVSVSAVTAEDEASGLATAGVSLRSLATFDLGGHACRRRRMG